MNEFVVGGIAARSSLFRTAIGSKRSLRLMVALSSSRGVTDSRSSGHGSSPARPKPSRATGRWQLNVGSVKSMRDSGRPHSQHDRCAALGPETALLRSGHQPSSQGLLVQISRRAGGVANLAKIAVGDYFWPWKNTGSTSAPDVMASFAASRPRVVQLLSLSHLGLATPPPGKRASAPPRSSNTRACRRDDKLSVSARSLPEKSMGRMWRRTSEA